MLGVVLALWMTLGGCAGPRVFLPIELHDFGTIVEGELFCWEFTLGNMGDEDLRLGPLAPSCACTSVPLGVERLPPGQVLTLPVCFDATGYGGKSVEESVSVRTNDPLRPWIRLMLRGYVRPAAPYEAPAPKLLSSLYLLLDVREPEDHAQGHLLGAVHLPLSRLPEALPVLPRGLPLWIYGGERTAQAVELLRRQGFLARALTGDLSAFPSAFIVGDLFLPSAVDAVAPSVDLAVVARNYILILDLRPEELFRRHALPGALRMDPEDLQAFGIALPKAEAIPPGAKLTVWVVDEAGEGAREAARVLWEAGVPAAALVGGLRSWRARYGPAWLSPPFWAEP